jgi:cytochrome b561
VSWINSEHRYGGLTKLFHWLTVAVFALQYSGGVIMQRIPAKESFLGLSQGDAYNWHKSLGLVALAIAVLRLLNRRRGQLPDWAPSLSAGEKVFIQRAEQLFYTAMFLMPVSGFVFVMAGGYGVMLFGLWPLPNPIGKLPWLAIAARWTHFVTAWLLAITILAHIGLVLRHQLFLRNGLLKRMLP